MRTTVHPAAKAGPSFPAPIRPHWQATAAAKGFRILARVHDRYHLLLRCRTCRRDFPTKLFVLMRGQPLCPHCLAARRGALAAEAGVAFLGPDPDHAAYGQFRAPCGHILRRQFDLIARVARGETGLRCETCHTAREAAEARRFGWERLGPCPSGRPNYRLYRHRCGHVQRVAQANMLWGQCDCAGCGQGWSARPSFLYLFEIHLPARGPRPARQYLKLGYSAHPVKRHRHQLGLPPDASVAMLRVVAMASGHAACACEMALHRQLRRAHPDAVVPRAEFADGINVTREIYRPALRPVIEAALDRIAADAGAGRTQPTPTPTTGAAAS